MKLRFSKQGAKFPVVHCHWMIFADWVCFEKHVNSSRERVYITIASFNYTYKRVLPKEGIVCDTLNI